MLTSLTLTDINLMHSRIFTAHAFYETRIHMEVVHKEYICGGKIALGQRGRNMVTHTHTHTLSFSHACMLLLKAITASIAVICCAFDFLSQLVTEPNPILIHFVSEN